MAYATRQDIIDLVGEDALSLLADRDGDFVADDDVIDKAIAQASGEIDSYIGARYPLPLGRETDTLRQPCIDIAIYRLGVDGATSFENAREKYEDAIALLKRIGDGKAVLVFAPDPDAEPDAEPQRPQPVVTAGPERIFTRDKMRGL